MKRRVTLTQHARDRINERVPGGAPMAYREVHQALRDGRRSCRMPAWANRGHTKRGWNSDHGGSRTLRWLWNADQTRCYLVDLGTRGRCGVITVIARRQEAA